MPNQEQLKVFKRLPNGIRKIILATNIAETSITISNIKYVIDTGFYKTKYYIPKSGIDILEVQIISKNNAVQVSYSYDIIIYSSGREELVEIQRESVLGFTQKNISRR